MGKDLPLSFASNVAHFTLSTFSFFPCVSYSDVPLSNRVFTPGMQASYFPVCEVFEAGDTVNHSRIKKPGPGSTGWYRTHFQVASARKTKVELYLYVFKVSDTAVVLAHSQRELLCFIPRNSPWIGTRRRFKYRRFLRLAGCHKIPKYWTLLPQEKCKGDTKDRFLSFPFHFQTCLLTSCKQL